MGKVCQPQHFSALRVSEFLSAAVVQHCDQECLAEGRLCELSSRKQSPNGREAWQQASGAGSSKATPSSTHWKRGSELEVGHGSAQSPPPAISFLHQGCIISPNSTNWGPRTLILEPVENMPHTGNKQIKRINSILGKNQCFSERILLPMQ